MSSIFLKLLLTRELKMNTDKSKNITPIGISCLPIDWIEINPFLPPEIPKLSMNENKSSIKKPILSFSFFAYKIVNIITL